MRRERGGKVIKKTIKLKPSKELDKWESNKKIYDKRLLMEVCIEERQEKKSNEKYEYDYKQKKKSK